MFAVPAAVFAPLANAADTWAVIVWSEPQAVAGQGSGVTTDEAFEKAMAACSGSGGTACTVAVAKENGCAAIAVKGSVAFGAAADTLDEAKSVALSREPGSSLKTAICAIDPAKKEAPPAPVGRDTDGDGLSDRDELANLTNIFLPDTDLDGVNDGDEVKNGTNPLLLISN